MNASRYTLPLLIGLGWPLDASLMTSGFDDNPIPHYDGVPTVKVDAYLTRVYIDLIGREPLPEELEAERTALRAGDLAVEARRELVNRLMGGDGTHLDAYDRKLKDDLSGRFLDGARRKA